MTLPTQRAFIVALGVLPIVLIAIAYPRSTLTLSLADANGALGAVIVVLGVMASVELELRALRRLQGLLVLPLLAAAVLTSVDYPGNDKDSCRDNLHCDVHRALVYTLCGVELVMAWTRGYGVLGLVPFVALGGVGLVYTEVVDVEAPVITVVELLAAAWARVLAACATRHEGPLWEGVLGRPRRAVGVCVGDRSYVNL